MPVYPARPAAMKYRTLPLPGRLCGAIFCLLALTAGAATAEPVTLAVIGDSATSGYGLGRNEGFVDQLDAWLKANGAPPVEIRNHTAPGLTTADALALLGRERDASADAMIVQLGGSDTSSSIEQGETRANLGDILELARQKGTSVLLVGDLMNVHQLPAVRQEYDSLFPQLAVEAGAVLYPSYYHVFGGRLSDVPPKYLLWDRGHPTAEAVRMIVDDIGPAVLELVEGAGAERAGN